MDEHGNGAVVIPLSAVGRARMHPMPTLRVGSEVRGVCLNSERFWSAVLQLDKSKLEDPRAQREWSLLI